MSREADDDGGNGGQTAGAPWLTHLAHDLRGPLSPLAMAVSLLQTGRAGPAQQPELYALMPAVGPFSFLWHGAIPYMPESEQWQQGLIPALRDHSVRVIDLAHLRGLVSAPSFHTAAAVIYIRAAWPIRSLRWPVLALNAAMLLSTPVEGTHYLADMLIGAAVATAMLYLVERVARAD